MPSKSAVIFGLEGLELNEVEQGFFKETNPFGYILFARNINNPDQLRSLTDSIRAISGDASTPILIDQEGGRVQRLRAPHWREAPAAKLFGDLWHKSPDDAKLAVELNTTLISAELNNVGIDVDCAPLLDVPIPEVNEIIGDRAFSSDIDITIELARIQADTFLKNDIMPIIKHIPGHGRATSDSHLELPIVSASEEILENSDFAAFKALSNYPMAMTAHIVYEAFDATLPATSSPTIIEKIIRQKIGFEGLLITDDLSMKALSGPFDMRAKDCLAAGCDILLHCNGDMGEMKSIAKGMRAMSDISNRRWATARSKRGAAIPIDVGSTLDKLNQLLA